MKEGGGRENGWGEYCEYKEGEAKEGNGKDADKQGVIERCRAGPDSN